MTTLTVIVVWAVVSVVATFTAVRLVSMNQYED